MMIDDRQPVVVEQPPGRYRTVESVEDAPDREVNRLMAQGWKVVNVTILPWIDCYGLTLPRFIVSMIREVPE
jgi:hypothetical protein